MTVTNARGIDTLRHSARLAVTVALALAVPFAGASRADETASAKPAHLRWAERLVRELSPARNEYAWNPTFVVWDEDGDGEARNRSVCSSFVSHDLERAYGFDTSEIRRRFGTANPQAKDYYKTIVAQRGFTRIERLEDIRRGDIIAVRYPAGSRPTGHVMIFDSEPIGRRPTEPIVEGTTQFEVSVIDSSHSFHGKRDTRYRGTGERGGGVGRGTMRLYASPGGGIAGYTWSTRHVSKFYDGREREIAIGRFTPQFNGATAPPIASNASDDIEDSAL